jgi:DNA-binding NtrC family response regulator
MIGTSSACLVDALPANPITPNLLIVDDDAVVRDLMVRLYLDNGYRVVGVSSAEEAIGLLAERNMDFVITDIKLPGLSGIDLIAHMQENFPDVPVIAITGFKDIDTAVNVLKHGAADFVVKPFDLGAVQESTRVAACSARRPRCIGCSRSSAW